MRIYGIFRGFPGLGRVVSGISIMSSLIDGGHEVKAYSYLSGFQAIKDHGIGLLIEEQPSDLQIMPIGLNPVGCICEELIRIICTDKPDLVIIDGEPLLVSTLAMVYPKERILALLNPADLNNPSNAVSSMAFFQNHYLSAGSAIVHGINKDGIIIPDEKQGCHVLRTNTILRQEIFETESGDGKEIIAILGGGTQNASDSFWSSTIDMAQRVVESALILKDECFSIYCNDPGIAEGLENYLCPPNVRIVSEYETPQKMYSSAKIVLCRAGRNTISEILYLNLPAILMASNGDFRSSEQENNTEQACLLRPGKILKSNKGESAKQLAEKIEMAISADKNDYVFVPGNDEAMRYIAQIA